MPKTYHVYLNPSLVVRFGYAPDQEDASDAAVLAVIDEEDEPDLL